MGEARKSEPESPFRPPVAAQRTGWLGDLSKPFGIILRRWLFRSAVNAPVPLLGALLIFRRPLDFLGVGFGFGVFVVGVAAIDLRLRLAGSYVKMLQALARGSITLAWLQIFPVLQMTFGGAAAFLVHGTLGRVRFVSPALITVLFGYLSLVFAWVEGSIANRFHNPFPRRE